MKRIFLLAVSLMVLGLAITASPASAWTPDECAAWFEEHGSNHPDCQWYEPPPPPPANVQVCVDGVTVTVPENQIPEGATPGECAPVVPPEQPTPPAPPTQPTPPEPDVPDTPDVPIDNPKEAEYDIGEPAIGEREVRGKEQEAPPEDQVVPAETDKLPYTGALTLALFPLGGALCAGGAVLRRRSRLS